MKAIVLGAGMGGLLAARALSDHFDDVTVVERDPLVDEIGPRKGVPQGRHSHGLLAAGMLQMEAFFPGLRAELAEGGAQRGHFSDTRWVVGGRRLATLDVDEDGIVCSRPQLEHVVRGRVRKVAKIVVERDVLGLRWSGKRVDGVNVKTRADGREEALEADLVVDATGRGSKLGQWLSEADFPAPRQDRVKVGVSYTTAVIRRKKEDPIAIILASVPPNKRCGVALALDEERFMVTTMGYLGERPEPTHESMVEFAKSMPSSELHDLLRKNEPLEEPITATMPFCERRLFEELDRHPEGVLAFGDAVCAFNPIFGQGMSIAALEAQALRDCLAAQKGDGLWRRFYQRIKPVIDVPWSMAVGNDLRFPEVEGKRAFGSSLLHRYLDRVLAVAARDPIVGTAFLRVTHLLDPPTALFAPKIVLRAMRG